MIAENNPILTEASEKLYTYNADEMTRQRSQARAEYIAHEKAVNNRMTKLFEEIAVLTAEKQTWDAERQTLTAEKQTWDAERQTLTAEIEFLRSKVAALDHAKPAEQRLEQ